MMLGLNINRVLEQNLFCVKILGLKHYADPTRVIGATYNVVLPFGINISVAIGGSNPRREFEYIKELPFFPKE